MENIKISVVGLGYVGLPLALAFSEKTQVIGYDTNSHKINLYNKGINPIKGITDNYISGSNITFTDDVKMLSEANFHIIAVPTPVDTRQQPDLNPLISASKAIGSILKKGDTVVYESTVYPGATEEICIPILEKNSNLICGSDFKVGYSPERINPGDKVHTLSKIVKVVSGNDAQALDNITRVYEEIIEAGVYKAPSIKVAEASKVIENTQRDVNIAYINEISSILSALNINTYDVLEAAKTKWNFIDFEPGLVGGHCISVDPYYLTYQAKRVGIDPKIILSSRAVNEDMGRKVAEQVVTTMLKNNLNPLESKVGIFGLSFKENTSDIRNTKVYDIYKSLVELGVNVSVTDSFADKDDAMKHYNIKLESLSSMTKLDAIIIAVGHNEYLDIDLEKMKSFYATNTRILFDLKNIIKNKEEYIYNTL